MSTTSFDGGTEAAEQLPGEQRSWRVWLVDVADATGSAPRVLLAGLVAVGAVLGAGWWLTRPSPSPVEDRLPLVDDVAVTSTTATTAPLVVVHVAGAVRRPGVLRLASGARVVDAVDAAGGPLAGADLGRLNLAAIAMDGTRIYVPAVGEQDVAPYPPASASGAQVIVDLNLAGADVLETLPGMGPATAAAIVDYRSRHGPFRSVDELLQVRGIGEAKLASLRERVRV